MATEKSHFSSHLANLVSKKPVGYYEGHDNSEYSWFTTVGLDMTCMMIQGERVQSDLMRAAWSLVLHKGIRE